MSLSVTQWGEKMKQLTKRASNIELLRIITLIFIIAHHYSLHGGFDFDAGFCTNLLITQIFSIGGKLGVNIFVLISGYFLSKQPVFRWKSILNFFVQVSFFSIAISLIFYAFSADTLTIKAIIKSLFPLVFNEWWFASAFFLLMFFAPVLSSFLKSCNKKTHLIYIAFMFLIWCVIPSFIEKYVQFNELLWFVFLFFVGSYIEKYSHSSSKNKLINGLLFSASMVAIIGYFLFFDFFVKNKNFFDEYNLYIVTRLNSIILTVASVSLFSLVIHSKPFYNKFINRISACMFGVYLIHDHRLIRSFLWEDLFKNSQYQNSNMLIIHAISSVAIVFAVCTILSLGYNLTVERLLDKFLNKYAQKIESKVTNILSKK